ncbi:hypothetical protein ACWCQN_19620 [Streptomyces sp. NPDC001984]
MIKGLHFHDLRHTGNTLAASTGAGTRELVARMGHSTARAALIHQHASAEHDRLIADAVSRLVDKGLKKPRKAKEQQDRKPKGHVGDKIESPRGTWGTRKADRNPWKRSGPGGGMIL